MNFFKKKIFLPFLKLQIGIIIFSFGPILSNYASAFEYSEYRFQFSYLLIILIFLIYFYIWQETLKNMSLSIAYSYRSLILIWNLVWAYLFADQTITLFNLIGAILILAGIITIKND